MLSVTPIAGRCELYPMSAHMNCTAILVGPHSSCATLMAGGLWLWQFRTPWRLGNLKVQEFRVWVSDVGRTGGDSIITNVMVLFSQCSYSIISLTHTSKMILAVTSAFLSRNINTYCEHLPVSRVVMCSCIAPSLFCCCVHSL